MVQAIFVNKYTIKRITHTNPSCFGIKNHSFGNIKIKICINIGMHNARPRFDDWHGSIFTHILN